MEEYLSKNETLVLSIIEDYVNMNRCFQITKIIPFIQVRMREQSIHLKQRGIEKILKSLIKRKWIIEGSKLIRSEMLNNENRDKIYRFICNQPGVYFNQISKHLNLSNYILSWHLDMLLKFKFIRNKKIENHEVFFSSNLPEDHKRDLVYSYLSRGKIKKILNYINNNPNGNTKTNITRSLNFHFSTVTKYLDKLEELELLIKKKDLNKYQYYVNERFYYSFLE